MNHPEERANKDEAIALPLDWHIDLREVKTNILRASITADKMQRGEIAHLLDLLALDRLEARYEISKLAKGRFRLDCEITAHVSQSCIVTLKPVSDVINENITVELWPLEDIPLQIGNGENLFDPMQADPPEAIRAGGIDLGGIVYEYLAMAINPYPRCEGAIFDEEGAGGGAAASRNLNPFNVLKDLKT